MILHDLIDDALSLIGVLAETQSASAEQCDLAIRKLNLLLAQWELDGIDLQWTPVSDADLSEEMPLPSGSEIAVEYYLAFALAPNFRKQVSQELVSAGQSFYDSLVRRTVVDQIAAQRPDRAFGEGQTFFTDITTL
jgi:hypothetical protein